MTRALPPSWKNASQPTRGAESEDRTANLAPITARADSFDAIVFETIVFETSGLADPGPIPCTPMSEPSLMGGSTSAAERDRSFKAGSRVKGCLTDGAGPGRRPREGDLFHRRKNRKLWPATPPSCCLFKVAMCLEIIGVIWSNDHLRQVVESSWRIQARLVLPICGHPNHAGFSQEAIYALGWSCKRRIRRAEFLLVPQMNARLIAYL